MKQENVNKLTNNVEKRFQTTMIGSLARIEEYLGFVWGHNQDMLSVQQADNRQVWQDLRDDILDHCNYQMRGALTDIRKYLQEEAKEQVAFTSTYSKRNLQNQGE